MSTLLAYIHTPEGDAALTVALDQARRGDQKAVVVTVTRPVAETDLAMSTEQRLDAVTADFEAAGVEVEIRQLPAGTDRAGGILSVVDETKPELVVIGMRRRRPVGELLVGSTSQRIIRGAACPVLVVKAPAS